MSANGVEKKYDIVVYGDTNGDGVISAIDYSMIKAHILNISKMSGIYYESADINKDGSISAIDFSMVKAHILNISKITQ